MPPKNGGLGFWGLWHWVYHGLPPYPPFFMGFYILGFGFSWGLGLELGNWKDMQNPGLSFAL